MTDESEKQLTIIARERDLARAKAVFGDEKTERKVEDRMWLSPSYLEMMRAHVDEGGQLSHRNGLDLLAEVERLQGLVPVYLGGTRGASSVTSHQRGTP